MRYRFASYLIVAGAFLASPQAHAQSPTPATDATFEAFWNAVSPDQAAHQIDAILKTGVRFDDALGRLRVGRKYQTQKTGVIHLRNRTANGVEYQYALNIPPSYDPAKPYQVRFQLHGGVGARSDNDPRNNGEIGALAGVEQIYVLPYAWEAAPWWSEGQLLNLRAILDTLKRTYNVDENRVVLSGVSDGATGSYFVAMRDTTPFASFLPLNGFLMVLSIFPPEEGRLFPNNLRNKPFFVVNGGKDPLYPTSTVEPYTRHLMNSGVEIDYHPQPEGLHNTRWWPEVRDIYEKFVADHPRDPHPAKLTWEAADLTQKRAHWLVLDELDDELHVELDDAVAPASKMPDANFMKGLNREGVMFLRPLPTGRVDLVRKGNTVEAATKGVASFTLLLSSDRFDMNQPVRVIANGREVFNGRVTPSVRTLLKWAARDNDRSMLYAAELKVDLRCAADSAPARPCVSVVD